MNREKTIVKFQWQILPINLFVKSLVDGWMTVSDGNCYDAPKHVKVSSTLVVPQVLHTSLRTDTAIGFSVLIDCMCIYSQMYASIKFHEILRNEVCFVFINHEETYTNMTYFFQNSNSYACARQNICISFGNDQISKN